MASHEYQVAFTLAAKMMSSFGKSFASASNSINQVGQKVAQLNKQASNTEGVMKLRAKTLETGKAFMQARQKAMELATAYASASKPTEKLTKDYQEAVEAMNKAKTAYTQNKASLKELEATAGTTGKKMSELNTIFEKQKKTAAAASAYTAKQNAINEKFCQNQAGAYMVSMAAADAFKDVVKTGAQFEQEMARVAAVAGMGCPRFSGHNVKRTSACSHTQSD